MTQQVETDFENLNKEELNEKLLDVGYTSANAAIISDFWLLQEAEEPYSTLFQAIIHHVNSIEKVSDLDISIFITEYNTGTLLHDIAINNSNIRRYFGHFSDEIMSIYSKRLRENTLFVSKINSTESVALSSIDQEEDFI